MSFDPFGTNAVSEPVERPLFESFGSGVSSTQGSGDFNPFGTAIPQEPTEMPSFAPFGAASSADGFDPFGTSTEPSATEMPKFEAFTALPSVGPIVEETLPKFDSFGKSAPTTPRSSADSGDRLDLSAALASIERLLTPLPEPPASVDFSLDLAHVEIPPPPPFAETALGRELAEFSRREFGREYVFSS
jgi:hypothetical protein